MKLFNIIKISLKNIKSNKLRSFLTMLGLVIGIASVIILVGIGNGATSNVKDSVQSLGTDVLTMTINSDDSTLEYSKEAEIEKLQNVEKIAPYKNISATVNRGSTSSSGASVIATNENYLDITNISTNKGRNLSQIDIENSTKVCILGSDITDTNFDETQEDKKAFSNELDSLGVESKSNNYSIQEKLQEAGSSSSKTSSMTISSKTDETEEYKGDRNNYLSNLEISNFTLKNEFKKTTQTYFAEVENIDSINVTATAEDFSANVKIFGNTELKTGINKVLIQVTAENGDIRNYKIFVNKK